MEEHIQSLADFPTHPSRAGTLTKQKLKQVHVTDRQEFNKQTVLLDYIPLKVSTTMACSVLSQLTQRCRFELAQPFQNCLQQVRSEKK